jgi:hypothetical protein
LILRDRGFAAVLPVAGVLLAYGAGCLAAGVALYRFDE